MQLPPLTRAQVRNVDRVAIDEYGIPGIVLMENAGRGAAEAIDRIATEGMVVILCGSGNNAGDGYVIARHLQLLGHPVRILTMVEPESLTGDAATNAEIASKAHIEIRLVQSRVEIEAGLSDAGLLIDALLGTGASGAPRGLFADAVDAANDHQAIRVAIDLPSGLDCDTGLASEPTFRANHTLTFVSAKIGFEKENANEFVGVRSVISIGVPQCLIDDIRNW